MPDFSLEEQYGNKVCGIDEVGRGPLAGPVVTACVFIPENKRNLSFISGIRDSKKLSRTKLEYCEAYIKEHCVWALGSCSVEEIDHMNILQATLLAMKRSFDAMPETVKPNMRILIDGNHLPQNMPCPAYTIKKGDDKSYSIAAASILAKLSRDRIMEKLHEIHPYYGWSSNVGYPSPAHKLAIKNHGITEHHRKSFAPVKAYIDRKITEPSSARYSTQQ
ncbi:MAG: ribonuclease HII [Micavibrio sp.]|nr:ribonuclease HII [Micavibrio sp.]